MRLADLLEALSRLRLVGVAVGMELLGQAPERLLDLVGRRGLGDAEHLIVVAWCRHYRPSLGTPSLCPCHVSTWTRAGRIKRVAELVSRLQHRATV